MVMPLPAHLRLPSPTAKATAGDQLPRQLPRSPIKKHLHITTTTATTTTAATTVKVGSPQKLKAAVAQNGGTSMAVNSDAKPPKQLQTPGSGTGRLRAATLQAVLGLLDRDDEALLQLLPLLHVLASLPLDDERTRRQCLAALQSLPLVTSTTTSRPKTTTRGAAHTPSSSMPLLLLRDSGRAKSAVSLQHCKQFLLACANEIHELEDVDPCFDYAEETQSEMASVLAKMTTGKKPKTKTKTTAKITTARRPVFDYASSVADSTSTRFTRGASGEDDDEQEDDQYDGSDDDDDSGADAGSQLSELLCRTIDLDSEDQDQDSAPRVSSSLSLADRVACRRVLSVWRRNLNGRQSSSVNALRTTAQSAVLSGAFAALKRHRATSTRSLQRKLRAFQGLKTLVKSSSRGGLQRTDVAVASPQKASRALVLVLLLVKHWDLVLLLLVACMVQFVLQ